MKMTDLVAPATPPSLALSSSAPSSFVASGMTLEAIMEQLQWMQADFGVRLDYLNDEMCQMNT